MADPAATLLVVGATSAIAEATARRFAAAGTPMHLIGRDAGRLAATAADLGVRGAHVAGTTLLDVTNIAAHAAALDDAERALGGAPDIVLVAHGTLPDQRECERSVAATLKAIDENFTSTVALVTLLAQRMHARGRGTIAVITSVAGDRGRGSNYVYGAAKGGVSIFLSGLRHRLYASGIAVVDIRPGFVDTPMTATMAKGPLWASPARVARDIERAIRKGTPVVYTPWFWSWIMRIVRTLPRALFHRSKL